MQIVLIVGVDGFDAAVLDEVGVEILQVRRDVQLLHVDELARRTVFERIDVKLQIVLEEAAKRLQDTAFQMLVILLVKQFEQAGDAHRDTDLAGGMLRQVRARR